jgi:hypothetical protein
LIAEKSLAMTSTARAIAKSASLDVCWDDEFGSGVEIRAAYAKVRKRMDRRFDSLALLLLLPPRGE